MFVLQGMCKIGLICRCIYSNLAIQTKPSCMKKYVCLMLVLFAFVSQSVLAQEEDKTPKRPENMGVSDFDSFKNNSFDILDESAKLRKDATRIDGEMKGGVLAGLSVEKLKTDYKALKGISTSSAALKDKISQLNEQGKQMLENAKNVTPKLKAPQATSSTNKSIKGLGAASKNLDATSDLVTTNIGLIATELKSRGEVVED